MLQRAGAWIFVSHSLRDFKEVRLVRNALEDRGHFPLLFYLRCLHDDAEVDSLIRREIDARSFFLLCDSQNAKASRWVQNELKIISSRPRRLVAQLDLAWPWEAQLSVIEAVASSVNVFISHLRTDAAFADVLSKQLELADYSMVGTVADLQPGDDWSQRIHSDIEEAIRTGFVVVLLSPESVVRTESIQWHETRYALECLQRLPRGQSRVVPVVLRGGSRTLSELPPDLRHLQVLDVSDLSPQAQIGQIVNALDSLVGQSEA